MDQFKKIDIYQYAKDIGVTFKEQVKRISPETLEHLQNFGEKQTKGILIIQGVENSLEVLAALKQPITQIATSIGTGTKDIDKQPLVDVLTAVGKIPQDKAEKLAELVIGRMEEALKAYQADRPQGNGKSQR